MGRMPEEGAGSLQASSGLRPPTPPLLLSPYSPSPPLPSIPIPPTEGRDFSVFPEGLTGFIFSVHGRVFPLCLPSATL